MQAALVSIPSKTFSRRNMFRLWGTHIYNVTTGDVAESAIARVSRRFRAGFRPRSFVLRQGLRRTEFYPRHGAFFLLHPLATAHLVGALADAFSPSFFVRRHSFPVFGRGVFAALGLDVFARRLGLDFGVWGRGGEENA